MKIDRIAITNFRNIGEEQIFHFNPCFTVIVGINGKGKSTILHALRIACGAFFLSIPDVKKRHINPDEIRLVNTAQHHMVFKRPVKIETVGRFPGIEEPVIWKRQILENGNSTTSSEAEVGLIRRIGKEKYERITNEEDNQVDLPVIAFFGTSRAHGAGRNRKPRIGRIIFKEGYQDWNELKSQTFRYQEWLSSYDILAKQLKEYPGAKNIFFDAIRKANPYIQEIDNNGDTLWLKVKIDDYESEMLPIEYHSDGVRFFTEMVAELTYRCIVLNGHLMENAIEDSRGVVMIDELDLHLHPNWQRHVVSDLKKAFPNLQFVATTHSAFIVQSLNSDELINLDRLTDVPLKDMKIDEVATDVMGVDSAFADENQQKYEVAKELLEKIRMGTSDKEIQTDISSISDPGLRAFLELNRLSNNKKEDASTE